MTLLPIRLGAVALNSQHPVPALYQATSFPSGTYKQVLPQSKLWGSPSAQRFFSLSGRESGGEVETVATWVCSVHAEQVPRH